MEDMIRLMGRAAHNLEITFDAGNATQTLQKSIMDRLDEAIRVAAARRRPTRSQSRQTQGDKRRSQGSGRKRNTASPSDRNARQGTGASIPGKDGAAMGDSRSTLGDLHEGRRSWGQLPQRDRDEIIQGISDGFLERYRLWIERYYRALQETED